MSLPNNEPVSGCSLRPANRVYSLSHITTMWHFILTIRLDSINRFAWSFPVAGAFSLDEAIGHLKIPLPVGIGPFAQHFHLGDVQPKQGFSANTPAGTQTMENMHAGVIFSMQSWTQVRRLLAARDLSITHPQVTDIREPVLRPGSPPPCLWPAHDQGPHSCWTCGLPRVSAEDLASSSEHPAGLHPACPCFLQGVTSGRFPHRAQALPYGRKPFLGLCWTLVRGRRASRGSVVSVTGW